MARIKQKYLEHMDMLRESGQINMFSAVPFLEMEFPELDRREARDIVKFWARTYGKPLRRRLGLDGAKQQ